MSKFLTQLSRTRSMLACGLELGSKCFKVIMRSLFGTCDRNTINQYKIDGSKKLLNIVKANYKINYAKNFKVDMQKPRIYMSNHLSLFDTPLFYATIHDTIRIVTKKELLRVPLLGKAIIHSEHAIVDRSAHGKNQDFFADAKNKLQNGIALWFFPEGTRSRTGELLPFKIGGFRLATEIKAQIIPVGIKGTNHILPADKLKPYLNQSAEINVGEPILTDEYNTPELQQVLLEKVRQEIQQLSQ